MEDLILDEFKKMLTFNTWMDTDSQAKALKKSHYLKAHIGYPKYFDSKDFIENNFNVTSISYKYNPYNP